MQRTFIRETVPAGHVDVRSYGSVFDALLIASGQTTNPVTDFAEGVEDENMVLFRLNLTGNIFYATTSRLDSLNEETHDLFEAVMVMFAAMTKALAEEGRSLFDFHDWSRLLNRSGFFVQVDTVKKPLTILANDVTVGRQILTQLLPGIEKSQMATAIGKEVLGALSGEYLSGKGKGGLRLGHLLFMCEEIMGVSSVSIRLFSADLDQMAVMSAVPCHKTSPVAYSQVQRVDIFQFVSPGQVSQYAKDLREDNEGYHALVDDLRKSLRG